MELLVNTYTAFDQKNSSIATLSDGGYVITWESRSDIYAQRYAVDGTPVGSETRINTNTADPAGNPSIAALSDGGYVITWLSAFFVEEWHFDIYTQRFAADGFAVGPETRVNTYSVDELYFPAIATLSNGSYVITWENYVSGFGSRIYTQRFAASHTAIGSETRITNFSSTNPAIAALPDGGYVITWCANKGDGTRTSIYAQQFAANGVAVGPEKRISTFISDWLKSPAIAVLTDGGYVICWSSYGQDGDGYGIYAQRIAANGTPVGPETQINTYSANLQETPAIAALSDGGYVICWKSYGQDGDGYGIYAQRFAANGTAVGPEKSINFYIANNQANPKITALSDGGYVITWSSMGQDGSGYDIYAQRFTAEGTPFVYLTEGDDYFDGTATAQRIYGLAGNDSIRGSTSDDTIYGGSGNDRISGGSGADSMVGGDGRDVFLIFGPSELAGDSIDGIQESDTHDILVLIPQATGQTFNLGVAASIRYVDRVHIGSDVSGTKLVLGSTIAATADVNKDGVLGDIRVAFNDNQECSAAMTNSVFIDGSAMTSSQSLFVQGAGYLENGVVCGGFGGNDTMCGGSGNDTIYGGDGNDSILAGAGGDKLYGNLGQDRLDGGSGSDTMYGGTGNDKYVVDNTGDRISETSTLVTEIDTVQSSVTWTLGANLENLILTGTAAINGAGNGLNNKLTGNSANNSLNGGSGNDTLVGNGGNDTLNGAAGSDSMAGGTDNDSYFVDATGDIVTEAAGAGTDTVFSYLGSYILPGNVENGRIMSTSTANLAGNTLNNTLYAGVGNNILQGGSGIDTVSYAGVSGTAGVTVNLGVVTAQSTGGSGIDALVSIENVTGSVNSDRLTGNSGNNVLNGGLGSDILNGGAGNDTMIGGIGHDSYFVDATGDIVAEAAGAGTDAVFSYLGSYILPGNVENGRIMSTSTANLAGNTLNNTLYAGVGNNIIQGGAGIDTVSYACGVSGTTGVTVNLGVTTAQTTGGSGRDMLGGIENVTGSANADRLTGNSGNNVLNAGSGNDKLSGGIGNDVLNGGAGSDSMTGGTGNDSFTFNAALSSSNIDIITDFVHGTDKIVLDDDIFTKIGAPGTLLAGAFRKGAGVTTAGDAGDRIILNTTTGALYYDANGSAAGAGVHFATLTGTSTRTTITASDFLVVG